MVSCPQTSFCGPKFCRFEMVWVFLHLQKKGQESKIVITVGSNFEILDPDLENLDASDQTGNILEENVANGS